jgi:hypothetical protein
LLEEIPARRHLVSCPAESDCTSIGYLAADLALSFADDMMSVDRSFALVVLLDKTALLACEIQTG